MTRTDWLVRAASIASMVIGLAVFALLYKLMKGRVSEFVVYVVAFAWLAIMFVGNKAIEGRIRSWMSGPGEDKQRGQIAAIAPIGGPVTGKARSIAFAMKLVLLLGTLVAAYAMYGPQGAVWAPSIPAQATAAEQAGTDCIARDRKDQRLTKASC